MLSSLEIAKLLYYSIFCSLLRCLGTQRKCIKLKRSRHLYIYIYIYALLDHHNIMWQTSLQIVEVSTVLYYYSYEMQSVPRMIQDIISIYILCKAQYYYEEIKVIIIQYVKIWSQSCLTPPDIRLCVNTTNIATSASLV